MEEFEAVVLAGGFASGLYPLVDEERPKVLLPVGGAPVLAYSLHALEKAGLKSATVLCSKGDVEQLGHYLFKEFPGSIRIELHALENEHSGTLDALRELKDKGSIGHASRLLVLSGDTVCSAPLLALMNAHRLQSGCLTTMLIPFNAERFVEKYDPTKPSKSRQVLHKLNKDLVQYFGLDPSGRVTLIKSGALEDPVTVPKHLLVRAPAMRLHTDLVDAHIYVLDRWVVQLVMDPSAVCGNALVAEAIAEMSSLRNDLVPFLINKVQPRRGAELDELELPLPDCKSFDDALLPPQADDDHIVDLPTSQSAGKDSRVDCHAFLAPPGSLVCRANSLFAYKLLNHLITGHQSSAPWPFTPLYPKTKTTYVGHGTEIGDKVQINNCVIGKHCTIHAGAQLSNSVIMDHCEIGSNVTILSSVVASNVTIPRDCHLDHAQLQAGCTVTPPGAALKDQAYLKADFSQ